LNLSKAIVAVLIATPVLAWANKIDKVETSPDSPDINAEFTLKLNFQIPEDKVSCGISVDWGDGEKQKLRVGNGQQVLPPFKLTHTYTTAGQKSLSLKGEFIARGLNSLGGCDVNVSGVVTIQDPAVRAEIAAKEKQKKDQEDAAKQAIEEKQAYLKSPQGKKDLDTAQSILASIANKPFAFDCSSPNEDVWMFKGDKNGLSKRSTYSQEKSVAETLITSFQLTGKDSMLVAVRDDSGERSMEYKINPKFVQLYNYQEFVKDGVNSSGKNQPVINLCSPTSAAAKTVANELSGVAEKIRAKKMEDALINTDAEIELDKLPLNLLTNVCKKTTGISTQLNRFWDGTLFLVKYELKEIAKNGGASVQTTFMGIGNVCRYRINIVGSFKGNSYSDEVTCGISTVRKDKDGSYYATSMGGAVTKNTCH
jgi:hypothetical protein